MAPVPKDPQAFGRRLQASLNEARARVEEDIGGYDPRKLIKLELNTSIDPDDFLHISDEIEIVSQEGSDVILAFATEAALEAFETKFVTMAQGGSPTYRGVLYALQTFNRWTDTDRRGPSLLIEGFPVAEPFALDVELLPVSAATEREQMWQAFELWLQERDITVLDFIRQPHLVMYRVQLNIQQAETLLQYRDVRLVDLPPKHGIQLGVLQADIEDIPNVPPPPPGSPSVGILDSGIAAGHPLLGPAVGEAASYLTGRGPEDEHGHGTCVSGVALYGDVEACYQQRRFVPILRLLSGRILDQNNANESKLIENQVSEAVRYFVDRYGCRIFNLSFGDLRKPYKGRHVRGLAVTIDTLARELGVLFVVPTGNLVSGGAIPADWRRDYPQYLLHEDAGILDPASALNVLTVGALARWDATHHAQRYRNDLAEQPIARRDQPSPFTRCGPTVGGAIKPDLVSYGGNYAVNERAANRPVSRQGLGEVSTCKDFAAGRLLTEEVGTSFAAPAVAHLAAKVVREHPESDSNLVRALLLVHARWPRPCEVILTDRSHRLRICGYGQIDPGALERSTESEVTLVAKDKISDGNHHFYEVPLPASFLEGRRRIREVSIALAHCPAVRTTRIAYKSCDIDFRLVWAKDLDHVARMFNAETSPNDYARIPEATGRIGARNRSRGTVQADTWEIRQVSAQRRAQKLFVVVTRRDEPWGRELTLTEESYALVACLRDRENAEAQLYTQLQARLRPRIQPRSRA